MAGAKQDETLSRRDVLRGAAVVGGAVAGSSLLGACSSGGPSTAPVRWDRETDVVVVGYGGAGAVAAITAAEQGASVIIVEKAPEPGGNTAVSSGSMRWGADAVKMAQFLEAVGLGAIDAEMARPFGEAWAGMQEWFEKRGAQLTVTPATPRWSGIYHGAEAIDHMIMLGRSDEYIGVGQDLFAFLEGVVEKQKSIETLLDTPASRLIQDRSTREVLGVTVQRSGSPVNIRARKGVILTLGGFEANRAMLAIYIEEAPVPVVVSGTPYNTGDGIGMVIDVGADLWHMNGVEWSRDGFKPPDLPAAFWLDPKADAWISVNTQGHRFRDESDTYGHAKKHLEVFHYDSPSSSWPNSPWYMLFDDKTRKAGPVIMVQRGPGRAPFVTYNMARGLYTWSPDNGQEIEKGWIKSGATLAEVARAAGVDETGLQETVATYNRNCRGGSDPDFRRDPKHLAPIDTPPFYLMECVVNLINTQGGPRRNAKGQVLGAFGTPIPRLYAGGEFGSVWGFLYPGGGNLPECVVSGILAGRHAAAEEAG